MRVSEETLSRGWVGMYWWVSGLLVGAYKPPTNIISLLSHARQRKNLVLQWLGVYAGGVCSINILQSIN